ncbi:MAG TPA: tetratricopeptide repeat protein [Methanospirillum sp.]|nr:tetratricopeptide repeat protein [Methanospirillum sp.]
MRLLFSRTSQRDVRFLFPVLVIIISCLIVPLPAFGETGYTQKWMGSSAWINEKVNESEIIVDLYDQMKQDKALTSKEVSYVNTGKELLAASSFADARLYFEEATTFEPLAFEAWCGRGYALEGLMRYQTALSSYDYAISYAKESKYAWVPYAGKARSLLETQQYQKATTAYNLAITKYTDSGADASSDLGNLYAGLAESYQKQGNTEKEAEALKKAEEFGSTE